MAGGEPKGGSTCHDIRLGRRGERVNSMSKGKTYISTVSARTFSSGATRDVQSNKPEFVGYESTMVQREFGRYMLKHQTLLNGEHRTSDNWKKGMPRRVYLESLRRHYLDAVDAVTGDR